MCNTLNINRKDCIYKSDQRLIKYSNEKMVQPAKAVSVISVSRVELSLGDELVLVVEPSLLYLLPPYDLQNRLYTASALVGAAVSST